PERAAPTAPGVTTHGMPGSKRPSSPWQMYLGANLHQGSAPPSQRLGRLQICSGKFCHGLLAVHGERDSAANLRCQVADSAQPAPPQMCGGALGEPWVAGTTMRSLGGKVIRRKPSASHQGATVTGD